jgi:hypothetical protein
MAQLANTFATFNAVGNREDLADQIYNISPEETPFISAIGREKVLSTKFEWQTDSLEAPSNNKVEQGNEASITAVTPTKRVDNRTQISEKTFAVTGTQEATDKAGRKSEIAYQKAKKMVALKKDMDFAVMQNTTAIAAAAGVAPQTRGVAGWLETNNSSGATGSAPDPDSNTAPVDGTLRTFTEALLKAAGKQAWESGGTPGVLYVPSALRETVSGFTGAATKFDKTEDKTLYATVEVYVGDFGRYSIVTSRHMRARDAFLIQHDMFALGILRPMKSKKLADTGDHEKHMINVEYGLICKNEAASAAIRDLQAA